MTHIPIYKFNYKTVKVFGWFGFIIFLTGLIFLIRYLTVPGSRESGLELPFLVIVPGQGLLAINIALNSLKNRRYYIEWDDEQIRYWQPRGKEPEFINKTEVVSVEIKNLEVLIRLTDGEKKFNLKHLFFPERKQIREMFEALNQKD
ncbi:MAG: hypothetical protein K0B09_05195 [Bacteroidales bacterium]|nr:hypothetical protein [Bacteroidales bacterium]